MESSSLGISNTSQPREEALAKPSFLGYTSSASHQVTPAVKSVGGQMRGVEVRAAQSMQIRKSYKVFL